MISPRRTRRVRARIIVAIVGASICGGACSGAAPRPEPTSAMAPPPTYEGYHDTTNCNGIMGWAWDQSRPDEPLEIDVYDGTRRLRRVTANQFRQDLLDHEKGNGRHGFTIPTPPELKDGKAHDIHMKYAGTNASLMNGPVQITCRLP